MVIIASVGDNNELGRQGNLCWHIREDLHHFKALTTGHPVVMGRKTWESLPRRPLPGRTNIVISGSPAPENIDPSVLWFPSLKAALDALPIDREAFIIGGASIYAQALLLASRLELTRILASDPEADTFFPTVSPKEWELTEESETITSEEGIRFKYQTYKRRDRAADGLR